MFKVNINSEVSDFMLYLDLSARAKVDRSIELLEEYGYKLRMPHCKKITDKLLELRIKG